MQQLRRRWLIASASLAAATVALNGAANQSLAATFTWTGQALTPLWSQNSFGVTNWVGNVFPASSPATQLVFNGFANQSAPFQNMADPFELNRLTFGGPAGFSMNGQALRFMADGTTMPQIVQNSAVQQIINQPLVLGADTTFAGAGAGTVSVLGSINDNGGGATLVKSGPFALQLTGGGSYRTFQLNSGTAIFDGGTTTFTSTAGSQSGIRVLGGQMYIRNGAQVGYSGPDGSGLIGNGGAITVSGQGTVWNSGYELCPGAEPGGGRLTVEDHAALICDGLLIPGAFSAGTMLVQSGATVISADAAVGMLNNVPGTATVTGAESNWTTDNLGMGGLSTLQHGGVGTLNVTNFAQVIVGGSTNFWTSSSVIDITEGGYFSTEALKDISGAGGSIRVSTLGRLAVREGSFGGTITGTSASDLLKQGPGVLTLGGGASDTAPNSLIGLTLISGGGTLRLNKAPGVTAVASKSISIFNGGLALDARDQIADDANINAQTGLFDLNGFNETIGQITTSTGFAVNLGAGLLRLSSNGASNIPGPITGTSGGLIVSNNGTLTLSGGATCGELVVENGTAQLLSGQYAFTNPSFQPDAALTVNQGAIHVGSATVTLGGDAIVQRGTLSLDSASSSLSTPLGVAIGLAPSSNELAALNMNGGTLSSVLPVHIGYQSNGVMTTTGGADLVAGGVYVGYAQSATGQGTVSGSGSTWTLDNLYMGGTNSVLNITQQGLVRVNGTTLLTAPSNVLNIDGGMLITDSLRDPLGTGGTIRLTNSNNYALYVGGSTDTSGTFGGVITNGAGGAGGLVKTGLGTFTLGGGSLDTAANTYTGETIAFDGTIVLNKAANRNAVGGSVLLAGGRVLLARDHQIPNAATVYVNSGTLDLAGFNEDFAGLAGAGSGVVNLGAGNMTLVQNASTSFAGTINGTTGGIYKNGSGTLNITGTIDAHRLQVASGKVALGAGAYTFKSNGVLANAAILVTGGTLAASGGAKILSTFDSDTSAYVNNGTFILSGTGTEWHGQDALAGANAAGTIILEDHASLVSSLFFDAGRYVGSASNVVLRSGATASAPNVGFAVYGGVGTFTVTDPGTSLVTSFLDFGGDSVNFGGTGTLLVRNGASVAAGADTSFWTAGNVIDINGGSLTIGGLKDVSGGTIRISDPGGGTALTVGANNRTSRFGGTISDSDGGRGSIVKIGSGTFTLAGANSYTGSTSVYDGSLVIAQPGALAGNLGLAVAVDSRVVIAPGFDRAVRLPLLLLGGMLDLNDNDAVIGAANPKPTIEIFIRNARNGGAWNGPGITSSLARTHPSHATTLGVLSGAEFTSVGGAGTFSGIAYASDDSLVKYTWYGDTDFNGIVNFDDYVRTDNGFNNHQSGWLNGDFDLNGTVNFDDYVLIDLAFNTQSGTLGRALAFLNGSDRSTGNMTSPELQQVVDHFGEFGTSYGRNFLASVPEPASLASVSAFAATAATLRRRRQPR